MNLPLSLLWSGSHVKDDGLMNTWLDVPVALAVEVTDRQRSSTDGPVAAEDAAPYLDACPMQG